MLQEEEKNVSQETKPTEEVKDANTIALDALVEYKKNSIGLDKYKELEAQYKEAVETIVNGQAPTEKPQEAKKPDIKALREHLFHTEGITNLDYWQTQLALRAALIAEGERDPFLPYGKNISPTFEDTQAAERVADVVQQCIEYADGDPQLFTQELQRRTNDVRITRKN